MIRSQFPATPMLNVVMLRVHLRVTAEAPRFHWPVAGRSLNFRSLKLEPVCQAFLRSTLHSDELPQTKEHLLWFG